MSSERFPRDSTQWGEWPEILGGGPAIDGVWATTMIGMTDSNVPRCCVSQSWWLELTYQRCQPTLQAASMNASAAGHVDVLRDMNWELRHLMFAFIKREFPHTAAIVESLMSPDELVSGTATGVQPPAVIVLGQ